MQNTHEPFLFLKIGGQTIAIEGSSVLQVETVASMMPIHDPAAHASGLIAFKDEIIKVSDLSHLIPLVETTAPAYVVIMKTDAGPKGLLAHKTFGIENIDPLKIRKNSAGVMKELQHITKGVIAYNNKEVPILSARSAATLASKASLSEPMAQAAALL